MSLSLANPIPLTPILTDRTSEEVDEVCGRKYWWYKLYNGKGIVPNEEQVFLTDGKAIHEDLAMYAQGRTTDEVLAAIPKPDTEDQPTMERYSRRVGWAIAFGSYVEPFLRSFGQEVMCEGEIVLDRSPLWVAVTPDRVQRRHGGGLVYREYKSARTMGRDWQQHWQYAIQLHLGLAALEEEFNEPIEYGQVLGLNKGYEKDGRLNHPYVWGYRKGDQWQPEYKWGWDHAPVWEYPGGMCEWVERCGPEVADKQFGWSAPVMLDRRLLDNWVWQRVARHNRISSAIKGEANFNEVFDQRLIQCRPSYPGPACPYLAACHNYSVNQDPIKSGMYVERTPHHDLELIGLEA